MKSISKGCAQFNINQKILKSAFVPLPPLQEQQRIVGALKRFEPFIAEYDKLEQQATKLDGEIYDKSMSRGLFACIKCEKSRWHMYIDSYEMLDEKERKIEVKFNTRDKRTMDRLKLDFLKTNGMIMMMPYTGNIIERAFSIHNNTDFTRILQVRTAGKSFSLQKGGSFGYRKKHQENQASVR